MATDEKTDRRSDGGKGRRSVSGAVGVVRARLAQVIWLLCVFAALLLAAGALLVALKANEDNDLVSFVLSAADRVDLGVFSREGGIKEFTGDNAGVKDALFNWGLGAIAWLIVGRILDRLIRP